MITPPKGFWEEYLQIPPRDHSRLVADVALANYSDVCYAEGRQRTTTFRKDESGQASALCTTAPEVCNLALSQTSHEIDLTSQKTMSRLTESHTYPGKLIIAEGIDGSGKSTQMVLLQKWLVSQGERVFFTEWNSSPLVKKATKEGKRSDILTPTTFSLLHATDFADRLNYQIVPPLKAGMLVIADRYAYTAFGRDSVRGVHPLWVRRLYQFAIKPDVAFYFKVPIEVSLERLLSVRMQLKHYEAGMDLKLSKDFIESFRIFQGRILQEYDRIVDEFGLKVIDATKSIQEQQNEVREIVMEVLRDKHERVPAGSEA